MAARFRLASGITSKLNAYTAYIGSFSKRSLTSVVLLTATITTCFLYSSFSPNSLSGTTDAFLYARNESHLLSPGTYDCALCDQPPIQDLEPKQIWEACLDRGVVPEYYLTVVLVAKDDQAKLQNAIDSTYVMAERTQTLMELMIIEWNPPPGRRPVREAYRYRRSDYLTYRIITVPHKLHQAMHGDNSYDPYEYEGRNVGIRFARGEFVVCTNPSVLWSLNMHNAIVSRAWVKKRLYTQFAPPDQPGPVVQLNAFPTDDELILSCSHNTYELGKYFMPACQNLDPYNYLEATNDAGQFMLAHRDTWKTMRGYREIGATSWVDVELMMTAGWTHGVSVIYNPDTVLCNQEPLSHHDNSAEKQGVNVRKMMLNQEVHMNEEGRWGLQNFDIYKEGVQCEVFRGGLGIY
ncbi:hypothetical protein BJV82DRAFT_63143 [Fennellomyces sp. T-0311]|nr:hypothetical protein BJV82DRAFT_63143 [Fennellomyces sp. T-0311]